jgi:ribosomal protein S18 acetylase RimI-like enzyme
MTRADIATMSWSGGSTHLSNLHLQLTRVARGEAGYLVACPPSDLPVAKCGIDFQTDDGTAVIWQVAVHPALQSLGIGTALIAEAERRILARGVATAQLSVETNNPRARGLYERLGYVARFESAEAWMTDDGCYETVCTVMFKPLR